MQLQRNYYEVLGLPPTAKTDEIKKKYRELARKFHPDLVQDKALGQKVFAQVNAAYRVLGDPERRAMYDATLEAPNNNQASGPGRSVSQNYTVMPGGQGGTNNASAESRASTAQANSQPQSNYGQQSNLGQQPNYGQAARGNAGQSEFYRPQQMGATADHELQLSEADAALLSGDPQKAQAICQTVLRTNPQNSRAYGILGDAYLQAKMYDNAEKSYQQSLNIAPSSIIQGKLSQVRSLKANLSRPAEPAPAPPPPTQPDPTKQAPGKAGSLLGRLLGRK